MIGLITAMIGGVLAADLALAAGLGDGLSLLVGIAGGVAVLLLIVAFTFGSIPRQQASLPSGFPAPGEATSDDVGASAG
jgi:hypothetical protein